MVTPLEAHEWHHQLAELTERLNAAEADCDRLVDAAEWHGNCAKCQEVLRLHAERRAQP